MRDYPTPREQTRRYYMITLPDGQQKTYEDYSEAESEAEECMGEFGLKSIEIDQVQETSGGTFSTGSCGIDLIDTITITYERSPLQPTGNNRAVLTGHLPADRLLSAHH